MATLEQVEQLRARADVSYEEAREALSQCGGDLLDALILLEKQGRTRAPGGGGYYTTQPGGRETEAVGLALTKFPGGQKEKRWNAAGIWERIKELLLAALNLLRQGMANQFEIWRKGERLSSLPILILIILVIVAFWVVMPILVVGLLFGWQYRFSGPDLSRERMSEAAEQVSHTVHSAAACVKERIHRWERERKKP